MNVIKKFRSAEDFRKSLEQKINKLSFKLDQDLERVRRKIAFERLLARLFTVRKYSWLLKGGYAMELRFDIARATKDIDLMISDFSLFTVDNNESLLGALRESASILIEDFFEFTIGQAQKNLEAPIYGGARFPVFSSIGGRKFVNFNVDVALGDIIVQPVEIKKTEGWLQDYGFPLIEYYLINSEQQFAEKLHAYTLPYIERVNTRVKDLVDMLLILQSNRVDYKIIKEAIRKVFKRRNTHETPLELPLPPDEWERKYKELANECNITLPIIEAHKRLNQFYKEIINGVYKS